MPALLAAALLVLAHVQPAPAQRSPFAPLPPGPPPTQPTRTVTQTTSANDSGLKTWQGMLIVLGGVVLLGGIGVAIVRDARGKAPVTKGDAAAAKADPDAHRRARQTKQRQRSKQKAARAQRRRNR